MDANEIEDRFVEELRSRLLSEGLCLVRSAEGHPRLLRELVSAVAGNLVAYVEGNSPRTKVGNDMYTSTEYPSDQDISLHHELSYAHSWPAVVGFLCLVPPRAGGQTPVADARKVLAALPAEVRDEFRTRRVRYVQTLHGGTGAGRSWQATFESDEIAAVEDRFQGTDVKFEWLESGGLRIEQTRDATRRHPLTNEEVWFNQADQWHVSNFDAETRDAVLDVFPPDELPLNVTYGDGADLDEEHLSAVRTTAESLSEQQDWRVGDILLLDNMLMMHGRRRFTGERRVLVALGGRRSVNEPPWREVECE